MIIQPEEETTLVSVFSPVTENRMSHLLTRISSASLRPGKQLVSLLVAFMVQLVQGFSLDALRSVEILLRQKKKKQSCVSVTLVCLRARADEGKLSSR